MTTFADSTYTASSASDVVVDGQTLSPGGVSTVDGTVFAYGPSATDVVLGTSTGPVRLGSYILGGFAGSFPVSTKTSGQAAGYTGPLFAGGTSRSSDGLPRLLQPH